MISCFRDNLQIVILLVQAGASLDMQGNNGVTALILAVLSQSVAVVDYLLRVGASVDMKDENGNTALIVAARPGNCEVIKVLLRGGANVESREFEEMTALHLAAFGGKVDAFALLLSAGANPQSVDFAERAPLEIASLEGHYDLVNWMLSHVGITRCGGSRDALRLAASNGHVDVMQLLTEFNVCSTSDLRKAFEYAMTYFQENAVKFLLKFAKEDDLFVQIQGGLITSVKGYKRGCVSSRMTRLLLDAGARSTETMSYKEDGILQHDRALDIVAKLKEEETEEKYLKRLDAIHRLLRQDDAVHSLSFLWPSLSSPTAAPTTSTPSTPPTTTTSASSSTPAVVVRPVRRSTEATSRVVKGALFRYARKTMGTVEKIDIRGTALDMMQSNEMQEFQKSSLYGAMMASFLEGKEK